jgi:hypothetical protein
MRTSLPDIITAHLRLACSRRGRAAIPQWWEVRGVSFTDSLHGRYAVFGQGVSQNLETRRLVEQRSVNWGFSQADQNQSAQGLRARPSKV